MKTSIDVNGKLNNIGWEKKLIYSRKHKYDSFVGCAMHEFHRIMAENKLKLKHFVSDVIKWSH